MMQHMHIDVGAILEAAYQPVYNDLVTRATGRAVRSGIEARMSHRSSALLTIIDFSRVGLIDFSCADEIVATLVRRSCSASPDYDGCFLFDGVSEDHLDAIEQVLERDRLALVVRTISPGAHRLVGVVDPVERQIWETIVRERLSEVAAVAEALSLATRVVEDAIAALVHRRLLLRDGARIRPPFGAAA
jgi:hypothetical protein